MPEFWEKGVKTAQEKRKQGKSHDKIILVGLDAIGGAVGTGPRTIKRWVQFKGFPACYCGDGIWRANPHRILSWFDAMVDTSRP